PALMVSTQRRSRSSRSDVASRSLIARIPVSGVRTSWAKAASAASTMPGAAAARARLRFPPAVAAGVRFFVVRFSGDRLVRLARDTDAMIPPNRLAEHGRGGAQRQVWRAAP